MRSFQHRLWMVVCEFFDQSHDCSGISMNFFSHLKISARLAIGFASILFFCLLISIVSLWRLNVVAETTREMMQVPLSKERMIGDWSRNIMTGVTRSTAIAKSSDPSLLEFFSAASLESTKQSGELQKKIEALLTTDTEKAPSPKLALIANSTWPPATAS